MGENEYQVGSKRKRIWRVSSYILIFSFSLVQLNLILIFVFRTFIFDLLFIYFFNWCYLWLFQRINDIISVWKLNSNLLNLLLHNNFSAFRWFRVHTLRRRIESSNTGTSLQTLRKPMLLAVSSNFLLEAGVNWRGP